jgi:hypothetical protein
MYGMCGGGVRFPNVCESMTAQLQQKPFFVELSLKRFYINQYMA